jgi:hypothetical protein
MEVFTFLIRYVPADRARSSKYFECLQQKVPVLPGSIACKWHSVRCTVLAGRYRKEGLC